MSVNEFMLKQIDTARKSLSLLSPSEVDGFVSAMMSNSGSIFFAGVGKNGHIASKAASTFNSTGLKVTNIDPVDAVHGDLGMVSEGDMVVAVSKSGNTEELLVFLSHCAKRTSKIWLVHSNKDNQSMKYASHQVYLDIDSEADHLNAIPTSSVATYCIFMQSVACEIARIKDLSLGQFVYNHPGGSIGKMEAE
jgi:arabinose-5-phosphate isomerase